MKTSERQRLRQNEVAEFVEWLSVRVTGKGRSLTWAIAAVVVIAATLAGYVAWRQRVTSKAQALLAEARVVATTPVVPPASTLTSPTPPGMTTFASNQARAEAALKKYLAAADAYPGTEAGVAARYLAASTLAELGWLEEARRQYQLVVDRDGQGLHGTMARLGLAAVQVTEKQYEPAITTFRELATRKDGDLPVDAILMQLGQACQLAGRVAEARQAYTRVVDEFPQSQYAPDARERLQALRGDQARS